MAITSASFVPEQRKGGGPSSGSAATVAGGMDQGYNHATDAAMTAMHETMPATHPVSHTPMPKGTGAGMGMVRKGGRAGK